MDSFDSLPLAAKVLNQFFCVNSGFDVQIANGPSSFTQFNRFVEIPLADTWFSVLWAIPEAPKEGEKSASKTFSQDDFKMLCTSYQVEYLIRSKQLVMDGCKREFDDKVITVWSAPNFNGWIQNSAAVVQIVTPPSLMGGKTSSEQEPFLINHFKARPESLRNNKNRPPFQDVHSLDHIYIKHLPRTSNKT